MKERPILFSAAMVRALLDGTKTQTRRIVKPQPPRGTFQVTPYHHPDNRPRFFAWKSGFGGAEMHPGWDPIPCPFGAPGDRLWVRETWAHHIHAACAQREEEGPFVYAADGEPALRNRLARKWTPAIHMNRWASRINLQVLGVRVERLKSCSEADAIAEGIAELVPPLKRSEGLTPAALAFAAAATVDEMPRSTRRGFLAGAMAAALGFKASASRPWEVQEGRIERAPTPQQLYALLWESINGPGSWAANPWVFVIEFRRLA